MKNQNLSTTAKSFGRILFVCTLMLLPTVANAQCPDDKHPHIIDLGLPSGTKWACCNVGASNPEDYGGYYAWGEIEEKDWYERNTYIHWDENEGNCKDIGTDIAGTDYDVAHVKWQGSWVMPSKAQCDELIANCTSEWTTENHVNGRRFTGTNGNSIFVPAAEARNEDDVLNRGSGSYWTSTRWPSWLPYAYQFAFGSDFLYNTSGSRVDGHTVRPVVLGFSTPSSIAIDETNFPDENFRNWVLAQDYGQDGVLTEDEVAGVTKINVSGKNIADLKGIEYFTALTEFECESNQLTSIDVSKNTELTLLACGINQLSSLDVSKNTELAYLWCAHNQMSSLDVTKNTALTYLACSGNQLTSLDVTKNTALTRLICERNQLSSLDVSQNTALLWLYCNDNLLTTLDVSKNTALTHLYCDGNQLTSLDVSHNTALRYLGCSSNQITSLDVSYNTALEELGCYENQLTSLDVSHNMALRYLRCHFNNIKSASMDALIAGLPGNGGDFYAFYPDDSNEKNVVTKAQVAAAKEKGWTTYYFCYETSYWEEYEGSDPEIAPVDQGETIDIGNEIDENTNLDGNVVGDVFYSISSGDGSYDPTEGCIVVTKPTDDSTIDGKDIFGEDFKAGYTGVVFKVAPGKGSVKVEAQTTGNMVLKVKIGDNDPVEMELEGRLKMTFPYNVNEETFVYIYGGTNAAGAKGMMKAAGTGALKIYGIEVTSTNSIEAIDNGQLTIDNSPVYNLNGQRVEKPGKGIYIQNERKVLVK